MSWIEQQFYTKCNTPGDIVEHLPTLARYTQECESAAELGVSCMISTWSFLMGLLNSNQPVERKRLYCVDINDVPNVNTVIDYAKQYGIDMEFHKGDSVKAPVPEVDLLFIDTWHIYGHLKRELEAHSAKTKKYIIMHDTEIDGVRGESLRDYNQHNVQQESILTGYPVEEITRGLQPAIDEFLATHPEWKLHEVYTNNNGLTILKRVY